jgi:hypothetical protein
MYTQSATRTWMATLLLAVLAALVAEGTEPAGPVAAGIRPAATGIRGSALPLLPEVVVKATRLPS